MNAVIRIYNNNMMYEPAVQEDITWTTERKGSPGKLTFTVIKDAVLDFKEGNAVSFTVDGQNVFYGYVFKKQRTKDNLISVTAYDQLRYFKNKDTYAYKGWTASQLLQKICKDFNLKAGTIADTSYVIPQRLESNKTLFDIMQSALDSTLMNINKVFVLYDNYGEICLQNIADMKVPIIIDSETGENFDYTSSIDEQTYNQVKLTFDNEKTGKRDIYLIKDTDHINEWGVLQYYDTLEEGENGQEKATKLLEYHNRKTRKLKVSGAFGDVRVRAGASPLIILNLGDIDVCNYMVVQSASHTFNNGIHTMDLQLEGGEFI